ncbi:hypothetical protein D3C80_1715290 [compost metagenome]
MCAFANRRKQSCAIYFWIFNRSNQTIFNRPPMQISNLCHFRQFTHIILQIGNRFFCFIDFFLWCIFCFFQNRKETNCFVHLIIFVRRNCFTANFTKTSQIFSIFRICNNRSVTCTFVNDVWSRSIFNMF